MKKLIVCTFYTPNLKYGVMSDEINKNYCDTFGIDFFSETDFDEINQGRDNRSYTWYKVPLLIKMLKQKTHEYVMYMDADAVFVRKNFNIIDILDENKDYDFICSADFGPDVINGGVLIFKNTDWSINFLERIWDSTNYISRGKYKTEPWQDQTIFSAFLLINQEDKSRTKIMSHYDNNAINDHSLRKNKTLIYHDLSKIRIAEIHKLNNGEFDVTTELNLSCTSDRHVSHGYASFYKDHIEKILNIKPNFKILDIGGDGGVLFDIFLRYYDGLEYYNITPSNYASENEKINKIVIEDINENTLKDFLINDTNEYDLVIADHRHTCYLRDLFFSLFFGKIVPGGLFVVEDIQTDQEIAIPQKNQQYGWGDPTKKSMTDLINQFNVDGSFDSDYVNFGNLSKNIEKTMIYTSSNNQSLLGLIYKKDSIVSEISSSDNIKEKIEEISLEDDRIKTLESKIEENNEIISKLLRIIENSNLS